LPTPCWMSLMRSERARKQGSNDTPAVAGPGRLHRRQHARPQPRQAHPPNPPGLTRSHEAPLSREQAAGEGRLLCSKVLSHDALSPAHRTECRPARAREFEEPGRVPTAARPAAGMGPPSRACGSHHGSSMSHRSVSANCAEFPAVCMEVTVPRRLGTRRDRERTPHEQGSTEVRAVEAERACREPRALEVDRACREPRAVEVDRACREPRAVEVDRVCGEGCAAEVDRAAGGRSGRPRLSSRSAGGST
jgi:hypothetical protein